MISADLYNTAITDNSGQELTHYIYQQPVTDADFTNAYWLGWIAWDNLPSGFILNSPIINDGIFDPQPLTIAENLDIGYMGQYSNGIVTADYFRASKLFTWDGAQFRVASNNPGSRPAEMANNREQRFVNKFNINLQAQNHFTLFFAIGVSTTEDANSTCNAVYATNFGIADFLTESYQITITNNNITVAGGANNNPFTITITVNPTDIDGTVKQIYDSVNNVYVKYAVIGYYTEGIYREIKEDGTASDYSYLTPMIRTHITVNDAVYPYILGGNSYMGLCAYYGLQRGYGYRYTFGSAAGLQVENNYNIWDGRDGAVIVFGGFQGTVADADASSNCASNYNLWQADGCNYCFQGINSITQCLIRRVFKYDDIKHHLSLMARWSDGTNTYDNGSDKWYSLVSEDNEFTGEFANGLTDRAKLKIWQLVGYDIDTENAPYSTDDKPPYSPEDQDDQGSNTGDDIIRPATLGVGGTNGFITQYSLTAAQMAEIGNLLWLSFTDPDYYKNFLFALATTGTLNLSNLLDYFVSLRVYPFPLINVPSHAPAGNDMYIGAGIVPLGFASTLHTINNYADYIDAGSCTIPRYYNDFRDLTHTQIMLYLPYCGTVQLNPADVVGGTLAAKYAVDFATGGCTAYVDLTTFDGRKYPIAVLSGSIGADIPLTASNAAAIAARIAGEALNFAGTVGDAITGDIGRSAQAIGSAAMGDIGGAAAGVANVYAGRVSGALNIAQTGLQIATERGVQMPMMAGGRGFGALGAPQTAYVQIRRGIYAEGQQPKQGYKAAYGQSYDQPVQVSSCTGFTVFANVDTSGLQCDGMERAQVQKMMQAGIYI